MKAINLRASIPSKTARATAIYVRTSREFKGQERVSSPQQLHDATILIEKLSLPTSGKHIYIDENRSGSYPPEQWGELAPTQKSGKPSKQRRSSFTLLIDAILSGEVGGVVIRKRNRLMRGFELHRAFWRLCKKCGVKVYATHESMGEDGLSVDIMALIAEHQLSQISDDIRAAQKYLKDKGRKSSPVRSIGYAEGGNKNAIIVPDQVKIVQLIYEQFIVHGTSRFQIANYLNEHYPIQRYPRPGVTASRWTWATVTKILINPAYIGMAIDSNGDLIESHCYPAILTKSVWHKAQERLQHDRNPRCGNRYKDHILGGILRCAACGSVIYTKLSQRRKANEEVDHAYLCVNKLCHGPNKAAGICEPFWQDWVDVFLRIGNVKSSGDDTELTEMLIKRSKIQTNLESLLKDVTTEYTVLSQREKLYRTSLQDCDDKISHLRDVRRVWQDVCYEDWNKLTVLEKRQRIRSAVESITVGKYWIVVKYRPGVQADLVWEVKESLGAKFIESPRAFPVMYIKGKGANYRKCIIHPEMKRKRWKQAVMLVDINGTQCISPHWDYSWFISGTEQMSILQDQYFRYKDKSKVMVVAVKRPTSA